VKDPGPIEIHTRPDTGSPSPTRSSLSRSVSSPAPSAEHELQNRIQRAPNKLDYRPVSLAMNEVSSGESIGNEFVTPLRLQKSYWQRKLVVTITQLDDLPFALESCPAIHFNAIASVKVSHSQKLSPRKRGDPDMKENGMSPPNPKREPLRVNSHQSSSYFSERKLTPVLCKRSNDEKSLVVEIPWNISDMEAKHMMNVTDPKEYFTLSLLVELNLARFNLPISLQHTVVFRVDQDSKKLTAASSEKIPLKRRRSLRRSISSAIGFNKAPAFNMTSDMEYSSNTHTKTMVTQANGAPAFFPNFDSFSRWFLLGRYHTVQLDFSSPPSLVPSTEEKVQDSMLKTLLKRRRIGTLRFAQAMQKERERALSGSRLRPGVLQHDTDLLLSNHHSLHSLQSSTFQSNIRVQCERGRVPQPQHQGYLMKRNRSSKGWKKRWFVLQKPFLMYYHQDCQPWIGPDGKVQIAGLPKAVLPYFSSGMLDVVFPSHSTGDEMQFDIHAEVFFARQGLKGTADWRVKAVGDSTDGSGSGSSNANSNSYSKDTREAMEGWHQALGALFNNAGKKISHKKNPNTIANTTAKPKLYTAAASEPQHGANDGGKEHTITASASPPSAGTSTSASTRTPTKQKQSQDRDQEQGQGITPSPANAYHGEAQPSPPSPSPLPATQTRKEQDESSFSPASPSSPNRKEEREDSSPVTSPTSPGSEFDSGGQDRERERRQQEENTMRLQREQQEKREREEQQQEQQREEQQQREQEEQRQQQEREEQQQQQQQQREEQQQRAKREEQLQQEKREAERERREAERLQLEQAHEERGREAERLQLEREHEERGREGERQKQPKAAPASAAPAPETTSASGTSEAALRFETDDLVEVEILDGRNKGKFLVARILRLNETNVKEAYDIRLMKTPLLKKAPCDANNIDALYLRHCNEFEVGQPVEVEVLNAKHRGKWLPSIITEVHVQENGVKYDLRIEKTPIMKRSPLDAPGIPKKHIRPRIMVND
jgi:hypothetical protein